MKNLYNFDGSLAGFSAQQGPDTNISTPDGKVIGFSNDNGTYDATGSRIGDSGMGGFLFEDNNS